MINNIIFNSDIPLGHRLLNTEVINYDLAKDISDVCHTDIEMISIKPHYEGLTEDVTVYQWIDSITINLCDEEFVNYARTVISLCKETNCFKKLFLVNGMYEEFGEVSGVLKRCYRGDYTNTTDVQDLLIKELGDSLWYITCHYFFVNKCTPTSGYLKSNEAIQTISNLATNDISRMSIMLNKALDDYLYNTNGTSIHRNYCEVVAMISQIAMLIGSSLSHIMRYNIYKCEHRNKNNTICGSGNTR